ncbi:MAG: hypothetical protein R3C52_12140 [Hyphomonadaceae bacterium]
MKSLPRLLVSSVVRGSQQGDSHGGLYLVDPSTGSVEQVMDWNTSAIDFAGRGADRGLRGVVVAGDEIFVAAADELIVLDRRFEQTGSYRNPSLKHCHEMCLYNGGIWIACTGVDGVVRFDLARRGFDVGYVLAPRNGAVVASRFDPGVQAPPASNRLHVNNVHVEAQGVFVSGRKLPALLRIAAGRVSAVARLPMGTHNARPFEGGVLYNDTDSDRVVWAKPGAMVATPTPAFELSELEGGGLDDTGLAREGFGRGLCPLGGSLIAAGSSPTTVSVIDLSSGARIAQTVISRDVRNAAHGLAVWPG